MQQGSLHSHRSAKWGHTPSFRGRPVAWQNAELLWMSVFRLLSAPGCMPAPFRDPTWFISLVYPSLGYSSEAIYYVSLPWGCLGK